ncbi:MAG: hypothetical protein PGN11_07755 [Quadrisphaera sp.]
MIVLVPVVYAFAKVLGFQPIRFGLPMAGIALSVHVVVPPHPGIVAGAGVFGRRHRPRAAHQPPHLPAAGGHRAPPGPPHDPPPPGAERGRGAPGGGVRP